MVEPLRHRQTKGAATDMFYLKPPRHISTLRSKAPFFSRPIISGLPLPTGILRGRRRVTKVPTAEAVAWRGINSSRSTNFGELVVIRLPQVRLTFALSRMPIAPHADTRREAPRLRLTRDDAFVAIVHRSVEKFGSCERSDFSRFHHHDMCRVPAPPPKIRRQRDESYNPKTQRERPPDS